MEQYLKLLQEFLAFKTISADPGSGKAMQDCTRWLKKLFQENGFTAEIWPIAHSNPVVFAAYEQEGATSTVLIYGHYDVQPAVKTDGWDHEPFKLTREAERLTGRGVIDNKGQVLVHIVTALELIRAQKLRVNLKFLIEGNEETGSKELPEVIAAHQKDLACDEILISDGDQLGAHPVIEAGFRGVANATLKVKTASTSLHSGGFGNTVPNAAHELSKLISGMFTPDEEIDIPGFYEGTPTVILPELPINIEHIKSNTGVGKFFIPETQSWHHKVGAMPALVVTGIATGYTGSGYANIVPNLAEARFNLRFGQGQDPERIIAAFQDYVATHKPDYLEAEITVTGHVGATQLDITKPRVEEIAAMLNRIYQAEVVYKYVGGTLPIIGAFRDSLGVEPLSIPLANDDSNMHGINENFNLNKLELAFKFSKAFLAT